ncbi:hypothetical protein D3C76_1506990 [compost metagenome]
MSAPYVLTAASHLVSLSSNRPVFWTVLMPNCDKVRRPVLPTLRLISLRMELTSERMVASPVNAAEPVAEPSEPVVTLVWALIVVISAL